MRRTKQNILLNKRLVVNVTASVDDAAAQNTFLRCRSLAWRSFAYTQYATLRAVNVMAQKIASEQTHNRRKSSVGLCEVVIMCWWSMVRVECARVRVGVRIF